jgi:multidrug resistance efflux pump
MSEMGGNNLPNAAGNGPDASGRTLSLSEKVRSLRLADKMSTPGGGASRGFSWFLLVLIALLAGGVGYNVYATQSALRKIEELDKKSAGEAKKSQGDRIEPGVDDPGERKDEIALQYKGTVVPIAQILVSPQVGGKVVWLKFKEGETVKEGAILAKIEETEFKFDLDRAEANVRAAEKRWQALWKYRDDEIRQAKAELDDALAQKDQAFAEYRRSLALRHSNALAAREFEDAEGKYKSIEARVVRLRLAHELLQKGPRDEQIAAAKAEVDQAKADADKARWRWDNCIVKAPVTGTILTKKAEENNQVNPAAFSNGLSASLCEMADLTLLEVDVAVVERDRSQVKLNQECRIRVDAWPGKVYEGYVSRIMPQADRGKNAVPVRVKIVRARLARDLGEGGPFVLPEMSATVTFLTRAIEPKTFDR